MTETQHDTLKLLLQSPDKGDGWRSCSQLLFDELIVPMPDELVEKDAAQKRVRLTNEGKTVVTWLI